MAEKNFLQDVLPPVNKKSVRNIPLPKRKARPSARAEQSKDETESPKSGSSAPTKRLKRPATPPPTRRVVRRPQYEKRGGYLGWIIGLVALLIVGAWAYTAFFSNSKVFIIPRSESHTVDLTVNTALVDSATESAKILFEIREFSTTIKKELPAESEREVEELASGTITVYNEFSTEAQRLIKNTRFESPEGLIFRIRNSIDVPGYTENGGEVIPGSIDVTVYADDVGEDYNIDPARFTIPGLEGLDQFDLMYAKSSEAMTGGFKGVKKTVSELDEAEARAEIERERREAIAQKIEEEMPGEYVVYMTESFFTYSEIPNEQKGNNVIIGEMITVKAPVFKKSDITKVLAESLVQDYQEGDDIRIDNIDDPEALTFRLLEKNTFDPEVDETASLSISGEPLFVWNIDEDEVASALAGTKRKNFLDVIEPFTGVQKAKYELSPFWIMSFPDAPEDIKVIEEVAE